MESLSGLTATARLPSGDTAIDEEEFDWISNVFFVDEPTGILALDVDDIVPSTVDSVASMSTISKLFLQPTKTQVNINTIPSIDLRYTAK